MLEITVGVVAFLCGLAIGAWAIAFMTRSRERSREQARKADAYARRVATRRAKRAPPSDTQ